MGRGADDRPAAVGGADRDRARGADRPAGRGQDRDDQFEQGRLVHRLFERADDRRVDGPRRCPGGRRTAGRCRAGPCLPRFHGRRGGAAAGRAVRERMCRCPTGSLSPTRKPGDLPVAEEPLVDADGNPIGVSTVPGDTLGQPVPQTPGARSTSNGSTKCSAAARSGAATAAAPRAAAAVSPGRPA